ncbi:APOBEC1 complementation factor-like isoform X1 [Euwallacea fornicatus]|uniref:APOBEC1 complementation factor-like isoform X1 n=1 Tax=Euwallacea fornicatus TaxID=995702 RepID=UPI00338EBFB3
MCSGEVKFNLEFEDRSPCKHRSPQETGLNNRLQELLDRNEGYKIESQNGQRIFVFNPAPSCKLSDVLPPPRGCEIFIGNIPRHMYEDQLVPIFQTVGKLYKFRLMLDFNQRNRGYGFATYFNTFHANQAIAKFNRYEIQKSVRLAICKSVDNRRLFVGNVPRTKSYNDILTLFRSCVKGVTNVILYSTWQDRKINRGFAFVEFESHMLASTARKRFHPRNLIAWNHIMYVDWADPIPDVDPIEMAQVTVLYVKNLPHDYTQEDIHHIFKSIVGPNLITRTHKIVTYAFVHCINRASAEYVMEKLTGLMLEGAKIQLEWSRPRQYSSRYRAMLPPQNLCLSVPVRARRLVKQAADSMRRLSLGQSDGST